MKVTELFENYYEEAVQLSEYAFQYKLPDDKKEQKIQQMREFHRLFGVLDEEKLAAKLHVLKQEVYIAGTPFKMGGIAGVATYPEYRRSGFVKDLIFHALQDMRSEGISFSMLHPFSVPFYRKYGWELINDRMKCTVRKENLKMQERVYGTIKRCSQSVPNEDMEKIYEQYAQRFSGMLIRPSSWWKHSVIQDLLGAVYYDPMHRPMGYLLYSISSRKMVIEEFVPLNHEARRGLWNFISQHDSMIDEFEMTTYREDPLFYLLHEPRIQAVVRPYFMGRIVDVERFLASYPFQWGTKDVILHISDSYAAWNSRTYRLEGGKIIAEDTAEGKKEGIALSIGDLTAVLLGYKKMAELAAVEKAEGDPEQLAEFAEMIPSYKPFLYDFF